MINFSANPPITTQELSVRKQITEIALENLKNSHLNSSIRAENPNDQVFVRNYAENTIVAQLNGDDGEHGIFSKELIQSLFHPAIFSQLNETDKKLAKKDWFIAEVIKKYNQITHLAPEALKKCMELCVNPFEISEEVISSFTHSPTSEAETLPPVRQTQPFSTTSSLNNFNSTHQLTKASQTSTSNVVQLTTDLNPPSSSLWEGAVTQEIKITEESYASGKLDIPAFRSTDNEAEKEKPDQTSNSKGSYPADYPQLNTSNSFSETDKLRWDALVNSLEELVNDNDFWGENITTTPAATNQRITGTFDKPRTTGSEWSPLQTALDNKVQQTRFDLNTVDNETVLDNEIQTQFSVTPDMNTLNEYPAKTRETVKTVGSSKTPSKPNRKLVITENKTSNTGRLINNPIPKPSFTEQAKEIFHTAATSVRNTVNRIGGFFSRLLHGPQEEDEFPLVSRFDLSSNPNNPTSEDTRGIEDYDYRNDYRAK